VLVCRGSLLLTGSDAGNLRIWSVVGVSEMRLPGERQAPRGGGLTMEDEMNTDGAIVSAAFDDAIDMVGIGNWIVNIYLLISVILCCMWNV